MSGHTVSGPPSNEQISSVSATQTREEATATNKKGLRRGPQVNRCAHSEAHKPLNRENTCPRWDSNRVPALEYPSIRPSPAPVRPDAKPRVGTCAPPSILPTSASTIRLLRRPRPGGSVVPCARFRSDRKGRPPEPSRPRTSTALGGHPAENRWPSWLRVPPLRTSHGEENSNLHDRPTARPASRR